MVETRREFPALVAGARALAARAFVHYTHGMHLVYLDEFGHIGPFISRSDPHHNTSPVFGVAGFFMPEREVRDFSSWFYQLKKSAFEQDIAASGKHASTWEKKGNALFTSGRVYKTKRLGYALINEIVRRKGRVFFHGVEKYESAGLSNPTGLYYIALKHAIIALEKVFANKAQNYAIVLDEHQSRIVLLESAIRTMFAHNHVERAKRLIEPPYQVESHLYQTIQAADWIASIIGPLWAYRALPGQFADRAWADKYFASRIETAATHSKVTLRPAPKQKVLTGI